MEQEHRDFLRQYQEEMNKIALTAEIREAYEIVRCLKDGGEARTFLMENRETGCLCVMKWAKGRMRKFLRREYEMLLELTEKKLIGIPAPYEMADDGKEVFFLREYISGRSLYEYVQENGTLSGKRLAEIGCGICTIVEQFQKLENPLVHRDIKPENLVLTDGGELVLIDFGTMRSYREEGQRDTFLIGSDGTAAPEQYGFRQTDKRTDVYAIGRTLWFLAAGSYQEDALKEAKIGRWIRHIIEKAASFDPGKRYQSASKLEDALERYRKVGYYRVAAAGILLICGLAAGAEYFLHTQSGEVKGAAGDRKEARNTADDADDTLGNTKDVPDFVDDTAGNPEEKPQDGIGAEGYSEEEPQDGAGTEENPEEEPQDGAGTVKDSEEEPRNIVPENEDSTAEEYIFHEPLIGQAVRLALGLNETEPITESMLAKITKLKIVGNKIYWPDTEIRRENLTFSADGEPIENTEQGGISDLSDLAHMGSLSEVVLGRQKIRDLSPLEGIPLCKLNLAENEIEDISALGRLFDLKELDLGNNPAGNLDALKGCSSLEKLCLDGMQVDNLDFVENLPVTGLSMWVTQVESNELEPLCRMPELRSLDLWLIDGEIRPEVFSKMKKLEYLSIQDGAIRDLTGFGSCPQITSLGIWGRLESVEGIAGFPKLTSLGIISERLHDMAPILQAENLEEVRIESLVIMDYSPLLEHPNLKKVYCTQRQKEDILSADPDPGFDMEVV